MALRYAVANGNWSSTSTWDGGTLPTSADDVYSNNFTVTIDQDVTVLSIRNTAGAPAVAGGFFQLNDTRTLNCTATGIVCGSVDTLRYSGTTSATIVSNLVVSATTTNVRPLLHSGSGTLTVTTVNSDIVGGSTTGRHAISFTGSGTLTINGNVRGGTSSAVYGIAMTGSGTINIVGNVSGGTTTTAHALITATASPAAINITGNVTSGTGGSAAGIFCNIATPISVTGSLFGGGGQAAAISFAVGGCSLTLVGNIISGGTSEGSVYSSAASNTITVTGDVVGNSVGGIYSLTGPGSISVVGNLTAAISGPAIRTNALSISVNIAGNIVNTGSTMALWLASLTLTNGQISTWYLESTGAADRTLYTAEAFTEFPAESDVKIGVTYGPSNELVGTLTTTPTPSEVAAAVWSYLRTNATTSGSMGERLKDAGTVATTGAQIAGFGE